jgi:hypothetical protein
MLFEEAAKPRLTVDEEHRGGELNGYRGQPEYLSKNARRQAQDVGPECHHLAAERLIVGGVFGAIVRKCLV